MARKKAPKPAAVAAEAPIPAATEVAAATAEPPAPSEVAADASEQPKTWGDPFRATITSRDKGFEFGEDRRFKQMVFKFQDKPEQAVIDRLKDAGFRYRAEEKSWTIQSSPDVRRDATNLARELAGIERGMER